MVSQIEHLAALSCRSNAEVGIVPLHVATTAEIHGGFEIYDHGRVIVRLSTGNLIMTDPADVRCYEAQFGALRRLALFGTGADKVLRAIVGDYEAGA
jgi:hypothetical protein